jgi:hypothetical protein
MEIKKMERKMQITACPMCGSKRISIGTLGDGIIAGLSSWKEVCKDCGYQGASLLFDTEEDYQKYLAALKNHEANNKKNGEDETKDVTTKEAEASGSSDGTSDVSQYSRKKNYSFEFILSIILSIMFLVIIISGSYLGINDIIFTNDFISAVLYFIGIFISVLIFFFLSIIFVETIYRSIHNNKK